MLAKVNVRHTNGQPLVALEGNSIPPGGNYFSLSICASGHSVPICLEHEDGNKVGDALFVQPNLQVSVGTFPGDSCRAGIAISCHCVTAFFDVLEELLDKKSMIRCAAI